MEICRFAVFSQLLSHAGPMAFESNQEGRPALACSALVGPPSAASHISFWPYEVEYAIRNCHCLSRIFGCCIAPLAREVHLASRLPLIGLICAAPNSEM